MKLKSALPFVAMVVAQVAQVGQTIATKKAIATGMHNFSFVFYSNGLAALILLPASFLLHRSPNRPALTFSVAAQTLGLGVIGFLTQIVGYEGITYAPTTVATAILNLIPGFTFLLAIIFGVERLDKGGSAKMIGTVVSVLGAIIVTFYSGPAIITPRLSPSTPQHHLGQSSDLILGGVLMLLDCVIAAMFLIVEALILKKYSAVLILMLAYCSITSVFSLLASFILEHDPSAFSLQSKTRLLAVLYALLGVAFRSLLHFWSLVFIIAILVLEGFFGAGFQITIGAWCVTMKGPLFVAIFHPLGIVIAAIMGVLFLGDGLYLGCLLGSIVIVIGFYGVILGKAKEDEIVDANLVETLKSPLLQDDSEEPINVLP